MSTIKIKNMFGQTINAYKDDCLTNSIISNGLYDILNNYLISSVLKGLKKPVVLDIGANIGNHAMVISRFSEKVFCFEPQHETYQILKKNIKENKLANIKAFNFGLSSVSLNKAVMVLSSNNNGASSIIEGQPGDSEKKLQQKDIVMLKNGDDVIKNLSLKKIDFIKIDVEGHEFDVITGLKKTINKHRPIIIAEWKNELVRKKFKGSPLEILPEKYLIFVLKKVIKYGLLFRTQTVRLTDDFSLSDDNDLLLVPFEKSDILRNSIQKFSVSGSYFKIILDLMKGIHQSKYMNNKIKDLLMSSYQDAASYHVKK